MTSLLDLVEKFLKKEGVHRGCHLASLLRSLERLTDEVADLRERGETKGHPWRIANTRLGRFEKCTLEVLGESQEDYEFLKASAEELTKALSSGEDYHFEDWGNGWQWRPHVVDVQEARVSIFETGFSVYRGQNGKPLVTKEWVAEQASLHVS